MSGPSTRASRIASTRRRLIAAATLVLAPAVTLAPSVAAVEPPVGEEPHRPLVHYTPEQNWMNDPNGLVYRDGTYHLYYQHNPEGDVWGNMSWGHATSTDLVTWTEQPLAIPQTRDATGRSIEDIFSGSVVVDHGNTSGLGDGGEAPMVAVYTSAYTDAHPTLAGRQAQSLAYSVDGGTTWTKYAGNPVLDRESPNFRDPKVFRYTPKDGGEPYWVMVVVEAIDKEVLIYRSENLIDWTYLSTFGPVGATGGMWEVPDLVELPVDGDTDDTRWVMLVSMNPGAVAGGSGVQYFVGDFDGTTFTPEQLPDPGTTPAPGRVVADFEAETWAQTGWDVTVDPAVESGPFGAAPQPGAWPGQQTVSGYLGERLLNSFVDGDAAVGTAESPEFTIDQPYLNVLLGGGRHARIPGGQLGNEPPSGALLWDGFEGDDTGGSSLADLGWTGEGDLAASDSPSAAGGEYALGQRRINTWEGGPHGDANTGSLTSGPFTVSADHLSMLVGGGRQDGDPLLQVQLLIDGEVARSLTGPEDGAMQWRSWDVADLVGQQAQLRVVDEETEGWGHLTLDHVVLGDEPARPRSDETTVNLVVDGDVVRSATGQDSEELDWVSWDLADLQGQRASVRVVDNHRGGWGHVLVDDVVLSGQPQPRGLERHQWLDWGQDFYASISFADMPDDRTVLIGWMNNWLYGTAIPTSPWRSAMSLPRELRLVREDGQVELRQEIVAEVESLQARRDSVRCGGLRVRDGRTVALDPRAEAYTMQVRLRQRDARRSSVVVQADAAGTGTEIVVDWEQERLTVDRSTSGEVDFHPTFAGSASAPIQVRRGAVDLTVYVDRSSVEVVVGDGERVLTSQVFPRMGQDGVHLGSEGGTTTVSRLRVRPLEQVETRPVRGRECRASGRG